MENHENYLYSELSGKIIKEAYYVYNYLGYGFSESVYERSLAYRLRNLGVEVEEQGKIDVYFEKVLVGEFRADIIVDRKIILELKAVKEVIPIHEVQLVNYLKATEIEVGLLINFGEKMKVTRRVMSNINKKSLGNYRNS